MSAAVRHCPKHNLDFKGRCPKCRARRASSRPVSRRRQSAVVLDRLPKIEPRYILRDLITTSHFVRRYVDRAGLSAETMTAEEWALVFRRADRAAERFKRRFGPWVSEGIIESYRRRRRAADRVQRADVSA